jgi:hypothetical protein
MPCLNRMLTFQYFISNLLALVYSFELMLFVLKSYCFIYAANFTLIDLSHFSSKPEDL